MDRADVIAEVKELYKSADSALLIAIDIVINLLKPLRDRSDRYELQLDNLREIIRSGNISDENKITIIHDVIIKFRTDDSRFILSQDILEHPYLKSEIVKDCFDTMMARLMDGINKISKVFEVINRVIDEASGNEIIEIENMLMSIEFSYKYGTYIFL